jgi:hypothetical protein
VTLIQFHDTIAIWRTKIIFARTPADIEITDDEAADDDVIAGLLRDVLLAQYEWTAAVFGLVP